MWEDEQGHLISIPHYSWLFIFVQLSSAIFPLCIFVEKELNFHMHSTRALISLPLKNREKHCRHVISPLSHLEYVVVWLENNHMFAGLVRSKFIAYHKVLFLIEFDVEFQRGAHQRCD